MKIYRMAHDNISFVDENIGYHSGQTDNILRAFIGNEQVGYIKYNEFRDEPNIQYILVDPKHRRKGIAKKMVLHLQSLYPNIQLNWGGTTSEGTMLYDSLKKNVVKSSEFERLSKELSVIELKIKRFEDIVNRNDYPKENKMVIFDTWNRLSDRKWEIEKALRDLQPSKTILVG